MKKYIAYILIFFAAVVVIDFGYGNVCDYLRDNGGNRITTIVNGDYDLLVLGSSKAHHNYNMPMIADSLCIRCYNGGFDGNGVILAYAIYKMAAENHVPEYVIYDVKQQFDFYKYTGDGDHARYFSEIKPYYDKAGVDSIFYSLSRKEHLKLRSNLFRYNSKLIPLLSDYRKKGVADKQLGYTPAIGQTDSEEPEEKDYVTEVDSLKMEYFEKFVALTKQCGSKLIVVLSPEYLVESSTDFAPVFELCSRNGIPVWDYFNDEDYSHDKTLFKDHCHLNKEGSDRFTHEIIQRLKQ